MNADPMDCARKVVARALKRVPTRGIGYLDRDDIQQELMLAALQSLRTHDGRDNPKYVYVAVANAVRNLWEHTYASRRFPRDQYGMLIPDAFRADTDSPDQTACAEDRYANWERLAEVVTCLSEAERDIVVRAARGEIELHADAVSHIRYVLGGGSLR